MSQPSDYEKEKAEIDGRKDAENDKGAGLTDLLTLGFKSDSSYDPPKDPILRAHYDSGWDKGKGK